MSPHLLLENVNSIINYLVSRRILIKKNFFRFYQEEIASRRRKKVIKSLNIQRSNKQNRSYRSKIKILPLVVCFGIQNLPTNLKNYNLKGYTITKRERERDSNILWESSPNIIGWNIEKLISLGWYSNKNCAPGLATFLLYPPDFSYYLECQSSKFSNVPI